MNGLKKGSTCYIFTRYKGTDTHQTGSKIISNSVLLDEITKLNRVILTDKSGREYGPYGSGNIIYIKKGESMTLTAKTNPVGATTWSQFTFKSQYGASAPFTVTAPTGPVLSGSTIPSVTIRGDTVGTGTLSAEYSGYTPQSYGTWRVHVYENVSDIGTDADIIVAPSFPDLTMRPGETMPLPEYAVSVYPKGALDNYTLEWRIIKVGSGGAAYPVARRGGGHSDRPRCAGGEDGPALSCGSGGALCAAALPGGQQDQADGYQIVVSVCRLLCHRGRRSSR